ncbi:MAG TPA: hypothetical protein VKA70_10780 [Blastocatellia bacterium]|nr:hypothetical protein [Blastocatellia bacterium]
MRINSILRIAGFVALILGAAVIATLLPELILVPSFPSGRSDTLSKAAYRPSSEPRTDPRLSAIREAERLTRPDGREVIAKALGATPEFERSRATRTLGEMIEQATNAEGLRRIEPLGWDAAEMKGGRWRLGFHYHRWPSLFLATEWEYDPVADRLRLLKSEHGPEFWMTVANLDALKSR